MRNSVRHRTSRILPRTETGLPLEKPFQFPMSSKLLARSLRRQMPRGERCSLPRSVPAIAHFQGTLRLAYGAFFHGLA